MSEVNKNWIWVFDQDFERQGVLPTYISLVWGEDYQKRGTFTLFVSDTKENIQMLQEDYFLYMADKVTAMVIKYRKFDSEKQLIELHGYNHN